VAQLTCYGAAKKVPGNQARRVPRAAGSSRNPWRERQQRGAQGDGGGEGEEARGPARPPSAALRCQWARK